MTLDLLALIATSLTVRGDVHITEKEDTARGAYNN